MVVKHGNVGLPILGSQWMMDGWMDGPMNCDFTSFSIVAQLYEDDGWMIMKGCVPWNLFYD